MGFELGEAFNGGAEWVCGSAAVFGLARNPVLVALLLTALALVVVYAVYRPAVREGGWRRVARVGIWMFLATAAVLFVHYYALGRHLREGSAQRGLRDVVSAIHQTAVAGGGYRVVPGGYGDDYDAVDDSVSTYEGTPLYARAAGGPAPAAPAWAREPQAGLGRPDNVGAPDEAETDLVIKDVVLSSTLRR